MDRSRRQVRRDVRRATQREAGPERDARDVPDAMRASTAPTAPPRPATRAQTTPTVPPTAPPIASPRPATRAPTAPPAALPRPAARAPTAPPAALPRPATRAPTAPPTASRLTLRKPRNRRRAASVWSRLPRPAAIADACGRALRRSLPAIAAAAVLVVVGGGAAAGYRWLTRSPRFAITQIVVQGAHHIDPDQLRAQLPIHPGDSVFAGLTGVSRAVRAHPWVAAVEVHRILPHTIVIDLCEHLAAAVVVLAAPTATDAPGAPSDRYLVDATGRPFKRAAPETGDGDDGDGAPILTGLSRAAFTTDPEAAAASVREAIAAADRWRAEGRPAVGEIHVDPHGAVTLHTRAPALAIQLGAPGPELAARLHAFDTAWAGLTGPERNRARAIHMGARPDHVTVAFAKD